MCNEVDNDRLNRAAGVLTAVNVCLTALTIVTTEQWRGHASGTSLTWTHVEVTCAALLMCSCGAVATVYLVRLARCPDGAGNKSELDVLSVGLGALWWSQLAMLHPATRRKRRIAVMLASMPTFRFRAPGRGSPLSDDYKGSPGCMELVVRTASPRLRPPCFVRGTVYWRGIVRAALQPCARPAHGKWGTVVLYDSCAQDEAGAELLSPAFTHRSALRTFDVARAVWQALLYSQVWLLLQDTKFTWGSWAERSERMLEGPMFAQLCAADDEPKDHPVAARVLWAKLMDEVLGYLRDSAFLDRPHRKLRLLAVLQEEPVTLLQTASMARGSGVQDSGSYRLVEGDTVCNWTSAFQDRVFEVFQPSTQEAAECAKLQCCT
jgi:hypothetical protein